MVREPVPSARKLRPFLSTVRFLFVQIFLESSKIFLLKFRIKQRCDESMWPFNYFFFIILERDTEDIPPFTRVNHHTIYFQSAVLFTRDLNLRGQEIYLHYSWRYLEPRGGILLPADREEQEDTRSRCTAWRKSQKRDSSVGPFSRLDVAQPREKTPETPNHGQVSLLSRAANKSPLICSRATLDLNTQGPEGFAEIRRSPWVTTLPIDLVSIANENTDCELRGVKYEQIRCSKGC